MCTISSWGAARTAATASLSRPRTASAPRRTTPAKLSDPSLIIYHPVRTMGRDLVVTNGDQTDTICGARRLSPRSHDTRIRAGRAELDAAHLRHHARGRLLRAVHPQAVRMGAACASSSATKGCDEGQGLFHQHLSGATEARCRPCGRADGGERPLARRRSGRRSTRTTRSPLYEHERRGKAVQQNLGD